MKKILCTLILLNIIVRVLFQIVANKDKFLRKFDPVYFANLYSQSQYVVGSGSKGIGDDGLYAFAGYYYLFQGGDVSAVNFEHPPLGKYLIGVSIFLFGNENVINIIYFALLLIITYKIGQLIYIKHLEGGRVDSFQVKESANMLSLVAVGLLAFDPLFLDHILRSQIDLPFTLFFIAAVYFFLKGLKTAKYFYLSFLFWGMAFTTRFFPFFAVIYIYLVVVLFLFHRVVKLSFLTSSNPSTPGESLRAAPGVSLRHFFLASLLVPVIYLISHTTFFLHHPSIIEFLRHKKWMLAWYTGSPVNIGNIWRNVFMGSYIDPTGYLVVTNEYWTLFIPMIVVLAIAKPRGIIYWLCILYLIYLTFLTLGLQKMLMPIYPLLIILAVANISFGILRLSRLWRDRSG